MRSQTIGPLGNEDVERLLGRLATRAGSPSKPPGLRRRRSVEPPIAELEHLYTQLGRAYKIADEWGKAQAAYETMLALGQQLDCSTK